MATEVVKIVDPDGGGDYSSVTAWEADFGTCTQSNYPSMSGDGDLVGADLIAVADCRCTSGSADTNAVTIDGWTSTGADNYIKIWTDSDQGYRHDGKWNTEKTRLTISKGWTPTIKIAEDYARIFGLQFYNSSADGYGVSYTGAGVLQFAYNILRGGESTSNSNSLTLDAISANGTAKIWNNIFYDLKYSIFYDWGNAATIIAYSNTIINSHDDGIHVVGSGATLYVKNNVVQNSTGSDYDLGNASVVSASNISEDATSPDSSYQNLSVTFVDAANDDYHLDSSDTAAKDAGTDLSSDPYLAFTDDIDGETRSGTWDIGADEYVEAGGGTSIEIGSMSLVFAGQSVSTSLDITQEIPKMALLLTGQSVHHAISVTKEITATALSWTGKTLGLNCTIHPAKMALSWAGQAVKTSTGVTVEIAKATLSWAGKSVSLNKTFKIAKMTLIWAGKIPGIGGIISWGIHRLGLDLTIEM